MPPGRIDPDARLERYYRDLGFRDVRGVDGDRRVAGNGHGAHVRGERGAAPRDQLRRDRGRAVGQRSSAAGRSADAGRPAGPPRRGNREAAVRARDLPARRSSARAGSRPWAGPGCSSGQGHRLARGDASLPVALRARAVVGTPRRSISAPTRWAPRRISAIATSRPGDVARGACVTNPTCGARERSSRCAAAPPVRMAPDLTRGEEQRDEQFNAQTTRST